MENSMLEKEAVGGMRLDKWLWAARLFKTRSLASEAISGGKVHVNGSRAKPGKKVNAGDVIEATVSNLARTLVVMRLIEKRGPAAIAVTMYQETEESIKKCAEQAEMYRLQAQAPHSDKKPSKKDRRQLRQFKYQDQ